VEMLVVRLVAATSGLEAWRGGYGLRVRMCVTGVWVVAWFSISLALLAEMGRQLGYWRVWPVPVSIWKGLRNEGWVAWPFFID